MRDIQVSIIVLSYNPNLKKLLATIKSAIVQKNVDFEIIVADDGSEITYEQDIVELFDMYSFSNYKLVFNKENMGTVINAISGLSIASGEYVYIISQGDYIFDEFAMFDFYKFSKSNNCLICFGDYVKYSINDQLLLSTNNLSPKNVTVYSMSTKYYETAFFFNDAILGASYFREKEIALMTFKYISKYSIYTEDTPSTAYALLLGIKVAYYPRKIAWYEMDSGISNANSKMFSNVLNDIDNTYRALYKEYPKKRSLAASMMLLRNNNMSPSKTQRIIVFLKYPIITIRKKIILKTSSHVVVYTDRDKAYLESLIY